MRCKIIFHRRVELTPRQDLLHVWIQVSQILLLAIEPHLLFFVHVVGEHLVLYFSLFDIGTAVVAWLDALEASASEHVFDFVGLLIPFR